MQRGENARLGKNARKKLEKRQLEMARLKESNSRTAHNRMTGLSVAWAAEMMDAIRAGNVVGAFAVRDRARTYGEEQFENFQTTARQQLVAEIVDHAVTLLRKDKLTIAVEFCSAVKAHVDPDTWKQITVLMEAPLTEAASAESIRRRANSLFAMVTPLPKLFELFEPSAVEAVRHVVISAVEVAARSTRTAFHAAN